MIFDIWVEGYATTGDRSPCRHVCSGIEAETFEEACQKVFQGDTYYNSSSNTHWGCQLFDNQVDASKSFG